MSTVRNRENSRCYSGRHGISNGQNPAIQARMEFSVGTGLELYDMQADQRQLTNLATDPQHQEVLKELLAKLGNKLNTIK
jgi:hypothetical protein